MDRATAHQWIARMLDEITGSPIGDLPTVGTDVPVSDTATWFDTAIDQGMLYLTRHCYPVPGECSLSFGSSAPRVIRLSQTDAWMATSGSTDGSKMRFVTDVYLDGTRIKEFKWNVLKPQFPDYKVKTGASPSYWYNESGEYDLIAIYPKLSTSKTFAAHGYVYPPSITYASEINWMPDEDVFALLLPFAAFYTAFKNISDPYMPQRFAKLQADFDANVGQRFRDRVDSQLKKMGVIVPPVGIAQVLAPPT